MHLAPMTAHLVSQRKEATIYRLPLFSPILILASWTDWGGMIGGLENGVRQQDRFDADVLESAHDDPSLYLVSMYCQRRRHAALLQLIH